MIFYWLHYSFKLQAFTSKINQQPNLHIICFKIINCLRKMNIFGKSFMGITFAEYYVHKTQEGKSFFMSHGDQFDEGLQRTTRMSSRLFKIGDFFCDTAIHADSLINKFTHAVLKKDFSFYDFVRNDTYRKFLQLTKVFAASSSDNKLTPKQMLKNLKQIDRVLKETPTAEQDFQEAAIARARKGGYDGIVCGHTHEPNLSKSSDGIIYANSGDWVKHFSALAMNKNGEWEIIRQKNDSPKNKKSAKAKKLSHSAATKEMVKAVNTVWPRKNLNSIYSGYKGA